MSKSQNTKDEQQKDLCITSEQLTEKWHKGELPSGWSNYNHGDNIDEFVENFPQKLSGKDEYDLRCCIKNFNEDYEKEEKNDGV